MTRNLLEMADCLVAEEVTNVAMESTGVYWKPNFNILESAGSPNLAQRQLRAKIAELEKALEGKVTDHHRFLLKTLWKEPARQRYLPELESGES